MQSFEGLSESEIRRRKKISATMKKKIEQKRKAGLRKYWTKRRKEKAEKEKKEKAEKEKIRKQQAKEREKIRNRKKPGRKKKTGPKINWYKRKKKRIEKENRIKKDTHLPPIKFKVMMCRNGNRISTIGKYRTSEEAYEAFNRQKEISNAVVFPRQFRIYDKFENSIDECIIIEKTDKGPTILRNEYGKLVEQRTDLDGWEIIDKFKCNVEETFWVWGYDNRSDRKTFTWIYDEMVIGNGFGPYEFKRIFIYRNKLLVRYDSGELGMVICKSDYDSSRLYNELQSKTKKDKITQVVFIGDRSRKCPETEKLEKELMELTGWNIKKLRMKNTTYYGVN